MNLQEIEKIIVGSRAFFNPERFFRARGKVHGASVTFSQNSEVLPDASTTMAVT